jgi:GNAT superfamily N-acetyltransferase
MSTAAVSIRPAAPADIPEILRFIQELAEYEKLAHEVVATEAALHEHLFGARPAAEVLLGELNRELAGFALYFRSFSTFLARPGIYLEDLYVRPAARGHGLGAALLARLAAIAIERGCGRLEWSVLDWNEPALGFYRKLGAVRMDEWTVHRVTGDALAALARRGGSP